MIVARYLARETLTTFAAVLGVLLLIFTSQQFVRFLGNAVDGVVIVTRPETTARIVRDCVATGVRRVWMHRSMAKGSSVSPEAVEYCRQHDVSVIAGACPMMFGSGVDFGHACMRWMLKLTGGLPT